jgi:hypothetical protein
LGSIQASHKPYGPVFDPTNRVLYLANSTNVNVSGGKENDITTLLFDPATGALTTGSIYPNVVGTNSSIQQMVSDSVLQ